MLEKYCTEQGILKRKIGVADGKVQWDETPVKLRIMEMTQSDVSIWGSIKDGKTVLIAPPVIVTLPAKLGCMGREIELQQVKVCRDLAGRLAGCRCLAVM